MKENSLISIISPCYNADSYIDRCVNSLQKQTYHHWEAIFINDGSIDNSLYLLELYSKTDSRIKVYSQENKGAAKAREFGISKATGNYITFLDIDDTLSPNALEIVAEKFQENPDIIVSGFNIIKSGKTIKSISPSFGKLNSISYLKRVLIGKNGWELCGKVYRKGLFDFSIVTPSNIRIGEDAAVFLQIVSKAKKIISCNYPVYNYIQYPESASHVRDIKYAEETLFAGKFIEDFLKKQAFYNEIKVEISAMFLLLYSNSSFKYPLSRTHKLVNYITKNHLRFNSLTKIPILKSLYVMSLYVTNGKIAKWIYNLKS